MDVSCQLHSPVVLFQGKRPRHPLDTRLGGLQSQSGHCEEVGKSLAPAGNRRGPCFFLSFSKLKSGHFQAIMKTVTGDVTL
jgi:hypothetical protein